MRTLAALLIYSFLVPGLTCYSQEESSPETLHPAFNERVAEREQMVKSGIENYPYQPVKDPLVLKAMCPSGPIPPRKNPMPPLSRTCCS